MRIFRTQSLGAAAPIVRAGLLVSAMLVPRAALACSDPVAPVAVVYDHADSLDEDDMCYWVHPTDPALSTVIVTDKFAGKIFVYDLAGNLLQTALSPSPRNVDTRYGVPFDGTCVDVVAFTDRTEDIIRVYRVDPTTRHLGRIDDGQIYTQDNYGFTLYQNGDGLIWGLTGDRDTGLMRQFELFDNGFGQMSGVETSWTFHETRIEGVVADDETGYYYLGEENIGIWRVGVFDHLDRTLIATVGDATGLVGDVEGLALYYAANGEGYLIASSQGDNKFTVIDRKPPHQGRGSFQVAGVRATDGIDVLNMSLNGTYSKGIFTAHNGGSNCCSVQGVPWEDIANALGLVKDTAYWDPRSSCLPDPPQPIQKFEPVADARVSESTPGGTYGPSPELRVRGATGAFHTYLRFDLSGVDVVQSAKLRLFCTDESPVGGLVFPTSSGWSENSITWANKPAATGAQMGSLGPVTANTWVEVDVTAAVVGGGPVSFLLTSTSTNSAVYQSGETTKPPQLVVQVQTLVPPVADLSASPLSGTAPLTVAFTDQSTGEPTSRLWSFGDGQTSSAANPQHVYAAPGLYTVMLQVSNAMGTSQITKTNLVDVQAPNPFRTYLPVADARVSEAAPGGNYGTSPELRVRLAAGGSVHTYLRFDLTGVAAVASAKLRLYCTDGSPIGGLFFPTSSGWTETGIKWSNKPAATGGQIAALGTVGTNVWVEVDVSSAVVGGGPVSFLATSSSSNTALYQSRETATPPELVIQLATATPPVAAFSGTPRSGSTPLTVAFSDESTGFPTSWSWSFGDGGTSSARNPQHVYTTTGLYSVTLQVTNALGSSLTTKSNYVDAARPRIVRTYLPVADARVNEGSPTTNYGKSLELRVRLEPGASFQTYLRFDLSDLSGTVTSAKLRLFCTDGSPSGGLFFPTSGGWTETAITWSTQRAATGGQIASLGAVATGSWVEVDVTPAIVGPGLVNLLMTSTSSNSALYASREATAPELTVTTVGP